MKTSGVTWLCVSSFSAPGNQVQPKLLRMKVHPGTTDIVSTKVSGQKGKGRRHESRRNISLACFEPEGDLWAIHFGSSWKSS